MATSGKQSIAQVEILESRQFLSATPLAKTHVAYPTVTGFYTGSETGATTTVKIEITSQRNGKFSGTAIQPDESTAPLTGTVTLKGAAKFTIKSLSPRFTTTVTGKFSGGAITGKFSTVASKHHTAGTYSISQMHVGIFNVGGAVVVEVPPQNQGTGQWESDTQIPAFVEQQNLVLPSAVSVDITNPGTSPNSNDANLSPSTIPAGTTVNCYALHFDVVGSPSDAIEKLGSITVAEKIVGIIVLSNSLTATNSVLGIPGDIYPFGSEYGLELNPAGGGTSDFITLSADRHTITIDWRTASSADNIRIVTESSST
jgi:hypothetical protein